VIEQGILDAQPSGNPQDRGELGLLKEVQISADGEGEATIFVWLLLLIEVGEAC